MSVALLSQAKKSECGTAQPNSCIADDNGLNEWYARTTTSAETHTTYKIWYRQTDKQTEWLGIELLRNKNTYSL